MPFCSNCGNFVGEGKNFCSKCGAPIDDINEMQSIPKRQEYVGSVLKCPNCGEPLGAFIAECPSCGYELRNTRTSASIKEFSNRLEKTISFEDRANLVSNFPIPNTKEDIFEFMILASTNIVNLESQNGQATKPLINAWNLKYEQSYQKAYLLFHDSEEFKRIQELYNQGKDRVNEEKTKNYQKQRKSRLLNLGLDGIGALFVNIGKNIGVIAGIALAFYAIHIDKSGDNSAGAELGAVLVMLISACTLKKRRAGYLEYAIAVIGGVILFLLARQMKNGAGLELGGVLVCIIALIVFTTTVKKPKE